LTLGLISGPVEGILTLCIVYAVTALKGGASFWHRPMLATLGVPKGPLIPDSIYNLPFTQWWLIYGSFVLLLGTVASIRNVVRARRQRKQDVIKPLYGLLPLIVTWILIPSYLYLQPSILQNHLIPFALFIGLLNAYSVGQIIIAHLVKAEFPYHNILLLLLSFGVIDSLGPGLGLWPSALGDGVYQVAFVFLCLGFSIGVYGSFVVSQLK
jgi:ethanolaminephosphotransferase